MPGTVPETLGNVMCQLYHQPLHAISFDPVTVKKKQDNYQNILLGK
jgi:hypothetical protein